MAAIPAHPPIHIPYLGLIPGGFQPHYMIRIKGFILHSGQRLNINLQCGAGLSPLDDVALHLSVRPNEFAIVRNHHEKFRWGVEERNGGCPIRRGHAYDILILAEPTGYKIAIDGRHFCDFRHRIPLNRVSFIHIDGDTDVNLIGYETESGAVMPYQPSPQPPQHHHQHHNHHHRHSPHHSPARVPIAPTAPVMPPSAPPVPGIIAAPYPGTTVKPLYPTLPPQAPAYMPMPTPINPTPPPPPSPYAPPYTIRPIEANPYPPYTSSPYPVQEQPMKIEGQTYVNNPNPSYIAASQTSYPTTTCYVPEKKKSNHTALKVAAAVGGIGLGAYALSKVFKDSSSSDSD